MSLALASTSPRRRALLETEGVAFLVVDPGLSDSREEELAQGWRALGCPPGEVARRLAVAKALASERRVGPGTTRILAADTVVVLGPDSLGKATDLAHARAMIQKLSGRTHEVLTGVALLDLSTGKLVSEVETSRVRFNEVEKDVLERFLASGAWQGKAGAYGVQDEAAAPLVEGVEGSRSNVVGLPIERVRALLGTSTARSSSTPVVAGLMLALALSLTGCPPSNGKTVVNFQSPFPSPSNGNASKDDMKPFVPEIEDGKPQSGLPERTLEIGGKKITVEVAATRAQREVGLMWRTKMADDKGMIFVYPPSALMRHSFWMHNTKIPLTVAFIDEEGVIVNLEDMEADTDDTHPSAKPVRLALEMNKDWFKFYKIKPGDKVTGVVELLPLGE